MKYTLEVDLHTHTLASDHAYSTIHDYVRLAPSRGIKLFANTDHGPDMEDARISGISSTALPCQGLPMEWEFLEVSRAILKTLKAISI